MEANKPNVSTPDSHSPAPSPPVPRASKLLLAYKSARQHVSVGSGSGGGSGVRLSAISKAGIGMLRLMLQHRETEQKKKMKKMQQALEPETLALRADTPEARNCRRVVVLGARRVGKTCLVRRFLRDGFHEHYEPTREDFHRKLYHIRGEAYQLDVLDAAAEREFPAKRRLSILTGDIFLLVFSLDDRSSFDEVCSLRSEICAAKSALAQKSRSLSSVPVVVCANKADLPPERHAVSCAEALRALGRDCAFIETSAKNGQNLELAFEALAERGGLPPETRPSQHRKVSIRSYQALRAACQVSRGQRRRAGSSCSGEASYGALYPLARRPSFGTDLRLVLASRTDGKTSKKRAVL